MPTLVLPARDRDHNFSTIQNDSDCAGSERNAFACWRGLGFACLNELSLDGHQCIVILGCWRASVV
jgi:hypothetical protein